MVLRTLLPKALRGNILSSCVRNPPPQRRAIIHIPHRPINGAGARRTTPTQKRAASTFFRGARSLWRDYPFSVSLASGVICFGISALMYANYYYQSYIIGAFTAYPDEVANKLRRALYYTNQDFDPKLASKYYKQALQVAAELDMDPLSDEVLGIKIKVAELMEKITNYPKAIEVLEIVARDCVRWQREFGDLEANKKKRTRVLAKTVAIHIKLGELYSSSYVWNLEEAESRLTWAVETILKEKQRRHDLKVTEEDEGPWVSDDEFGASLEALAHSYEARKTWKLAAPLFLRALTVKPVQDCHSVVLMNNLGAVLAQQSPAGSDDARRWAEKALAVAASIDPLERTEECDTGCAVAKYNLGEFAERAKDLVAAKKLYQEALSLSSSIDFDQGVDTCRDALHRLQT